MRRLSSPRTFPLIILLFGSILLSACEKTSPPGQTGCTSWQIVSSPNPGNVSNQLSDIMALASDNIWAVGGVSDTSTSTESRNLIEHWDGKAWRVVPSQKPDFEASDYPDSLLRINGSSANDLWAVGDGFEGFLEHWDGRSWKAVNNPAQPRTVYAYHFSSAASLSPINAWAVGRTMLQVSSSTSGNGDIALTAHWDGKTWSIIPNPDLHADLNGTQLSDVAALASDNVWAVGSTSSSKGGQLALIEHWNGRNWSMVSSPQPQGTNFTNDATLWSLDALSPTDIWAAGRYTLTGVDHTLLEHWDGSTWNLVPFSLETKKPGSLRQIVALSDQNLWALAADGSVLHWNGQTWSGLSLPNAAKNGDTISRIAALPNGQIWLAGTVRDPLGSGPKALIAQSCQ